MAIISKNYFCLILVFSSVVLCSSHAHQFSVGGKDGWLLNPSESYNHWAERLRFQVNDTLLFKYKKGSDSVLVVHKDNYDKCNTTKPILKLDNGNSVFKFERSGPFLFISGNKSNCVSGQKLIIVVLAVRNRLSPPPPPPNAPSPAAPPKGSSPPPAPTPASSPSPSAPGPGPSTNSTPGSDTPADGGHPPPTPPPHRSFATAAACINSLVLVSTVTFVLGGVITSL